MNLIAAATILTFIIYWAFRFKEGIPPSLSDDFYRLKAKGKSNYFDAFFFAVGLSMLFYGVYDYKDITLLLLAVAGFFLLTVPIASYFKESDVKYWHYQGAFVAITLGFAAVTYQYWGELIAFLPLSVFILGVILLKVLKVPDFLTWLELLAAGCIFIRLTIMR